ncbi:MAG: divalent metal cation transporter [Myxococcota bacterium]
MTRSPEPGESSARNSARSFYARLGPGLIFAGAAVGVSHLVQSTRAGASYGMALLAVVLLANLLKYPAFRFGTHHAAASGVSLLEGYRRQGRGFLALYLLLTFGTMWTVQAAVTVVSAGLFASVLGIDASPIAISAGLLAFCAALLAVGRYRWLDALTKAAVLVFTMATFAATAFALPRLAQVPWTPDFGGLGAADVLFIVALMGWMPSAIDVSVWQSLWTLAKADSLGQLSLRESTVDFHVGYIGTAVLAVCFLILGAGVLYEVPLEAQPAAFGAQLIDLYGQTLGEGLRPVLALSAFLVMFSTTLTVLDGFPRALAVAVARLSSAEAPYGSQTPEKPYTARAYWTALLSLALGSLAVLSFLLSSLRAMVDLATTLSFLTAPVLSWLNHRAVFALPEDRPSERMRRFSVVGIVAQGAFAIYYGWLKVSG